MLRASSACALLDSAHVGFVHLDGALQAVAASTVVFDPTLTDEEFERMSMANELVKLERTKDGKIIVHPPTGFDSGSGNGEINDQLRAWWKQHRKGRILDNNTGFFLPDGSLLSPDGGYVTEEQLRGLTKEDKETSCI